jgi:hypothetical protein
LNLLRGAFDTPRPPASRKLDLGRLMSGRFGPTILAALTLGSLGCEPLPPKAPATTDVSCASPSLGPAFDIAPPVASWNTVRAAFDGDRLWVSLTDSYDDRSGASNVMLANIHCGDVAHVGPQQVSDHPAGGPGLTLTLDGKKLLLLWSPLPRTTQPLRARFFTTDDAPLSSESALTLTRGGKPVVGAVQASSVVVLPAGGYALSGTLAEGDLSCPAVFVQRLDGNAAPVGDLVDVNAGGYGRCVAGAAQLTRSVDGTFFLSWLSTQATASGGNTTSLNSLRLMAGVFEGAAQQIFDLPSTTGVDVTDLTDLSTSAGPAAAVTAGSPNATAAGAWTPQYLLFSDRPSGHPDRLSLRDAAQPLGEPNVFALDVKDGPVERPIVASTPHGGMLAWTVASAGNRNAAMYAQRFAYNGKNWNQGDRVPLMVDDVMLDRHLQALVPMTDSTFFVAFTEGSRGSAKLRGAFVSF